MALFRTTQLGFYSLVGILTSLLIAALVYVDNVTIEQHSFDFHNQAENHLAKIHSRLSTNLYKNIQILGSVSGLITVIPDLSQQQFEVAVQDLFGENSELRNIAAAPDLIIKHMYPIEGNEAAIGLDYHDLPLQLAAVEKARQLRQSILAGPLTLEQGGLGLIVRIPIFIPNDESEQFWGIIAAVIDPERLFKKSGLLDEDMPIEIAIRGKDGLGVEGDVFWGDAALFEQPKLTRTLELPHGSWYLTARPKGGWDSLPEKIWQQRLRSIVAAITIMFILVGYIWFMQKASHANLRFKKIIESSPVPYLLVTQHGNISYLNSAFSKNFGYKLYDISSLDSLWDLASLNTEHRKVFDQAWVKDVKRIKPQEVVIQCSNGEKKTVLMSLSAVEESMHSEKLLVLYDISARKMADEQIKLSSRVFNEAHEAIVITDVNGTIVDVNPAFCQITEYGREDVIGQSPEALSGNRDLDIYTTIRRKLIRNGQWRGEVWNRKKTGELYAAALTVSELKDDKQHVFYYVGFFSDITESKEQQKKLELMAHYDVLTQLPNRSLFADRFIRAVAHSNRTKTQLAVCFLDLDNFKPVNDSYGHDTGDQLLIEVAKRIKASIREEDTVSRQGGDEFTLLLGDIASFDHCEQVLERILESVAEPYIIDLHTLRISASIGVTIYPIEEADLDTLLRHADQAMYEAKLSGKNRYYLFNAEQDQETIQRHHHLDEIKCALENNEFCLFYQPKVNMRTGEVFGAEALIRWIHPEKGMIPPNDFLPLIESTELENSVGDWVVSKALKQLQQWHQQGIEIEVSVNISSHHLQSPPFLSKLDAALAHYPEIDAKYLQLEILESSALGDLNIISTIIRNCRDKLGVQIALDDFGTGYSSLTHLRNLSAGTVKIDQSFIKNILVDSSDYTITDGVIALAESFGREVIAEGVETESHGLMLMMMGCDLAQGYGIARPMPAVALASWLEEYTPNAKWRGYSELTFSPKGKRIELFQLVVHWWQQQISDYLHDPAQLGEESKPSVARNHFVYSTMIKRLRQEHLFESSWLDELENKTDRIHEVVNEILTKYASDDAIDITGDLVSLDQKYEELYQFSDRAR